MDLLTVVLHELGHVAGLSHVDSMENPYDVMTATLETGVRRVPTVTDLDTLQADLSPDHSATFMPLSAYAMVATYLDKQHLPRLEATSRQRESVPSLGLQQSASARNVSTTWREETDYQMRVLDEKRVRWEMESGEPLPSQGRLGIEAKAKRVDTKYFLDFLELDWVR